jgi:hypothetical protein
MTHWTNAYTPAIGARLEGMAFQCITADTPDVLANLMQPHLWFSGSVCIGFQNDHRILLTWHAERLCLVLGQESDWRPFSLDRINMSWEEPWGALGTSPLSSVRLYEAEIDLGFEPVFRDIVAARHDFIGSNGVTTSLWVCTGHQPHGTVAEGDDLYVGLAPPANAGDLTLSMTFGQT